MSVLYPKGPEGLPISYKVKECVIYARVVHCKELIVNGTRKFDYVSLIQKRDK